MAEEESDPGDATGIVEDLTMPGTRPGQHGPQSASTRRAALANTLEGEIVPRLLMLCRSARTANAGDRASSNVMDPGDVAEMARLLLAHGPETAYEFAEALRHQGVPQDRICLDLLVRAAYQLAEQWEHQELSFPELMQGLSALQAVVKRYQ